MRGGKRDGSVSRAAWHAAIRCCALAFLFALVFFLASSDNARAEETAGGELCEARPLSAPVLVSPQELSENPPVLLSPANLRIIRVVVVASGDFVADRSDSEVFRHITSAFDTANGYLVEARVRLELAGVQTFQPGPSDPYRDAAAKRDASKMLDIVRAEWAKRTFPEHNLVAVFGKSTFGATYGLAYPYTLCRDPKLSFLFASQGGDGEVAELSFGATIAHEVGHALGMSHDEQFYGNGPSLMWPFFSPNVNGLSSFSLRELAEFEATGGTSCLELSTKIAPTVTGSLPLRFQAQPSSLTVNEGERIVRAFALETRLPGATFEVTGLPPGSSFDRSTGTLDFPVSYDLATRSKPSKRFTLAVTARTFDQTATTKLRLVVRDRNRPPVFAANAPIELEAAAGAPLRLAIPFVEEDSGDRVRASLRNAPAAIAYPGSPAFRVEGRSGIIEWNIPAGTNGSFPFLVGLADRSGQGELRTVIVRVLGAPPALVVPAEQIAESAKGTHVSLSVSDNASLSFTGLPPGTLVERAGSSVTLQYARPALGEDAFYSLGIRADSGSGSTEGKLTLLAPRGSAGAGVTWPGAVGAVRASSDLDGDGEDEALFYSLGAWSAIGCDGTLSFSSFGGIPGDIPLTVRVDGIAHRAVYRVVRGDGVWSIDGLGETRWGLSRDIPVPADLDGDGTDELVVYRARTDEWLVAGKGSIAAPALDPRSDRVVPLAGDLDGDGRDELIRFTRSASGEARFQSALGDSKLFLAVVEKLSPSERAVPFVFDLDRDGRADLGVQVSGLAGVSSSRSSVFLTGTGTLAVGPSFASSRGELTPRTCASRSGILAVDFELGTLRETDFSGGSASVLSLPASGLADGTKSVHSLRTAATLALSTPPAADLDANGLGNLAVFRENRQIGSGQWLLALDAGPAAFAEIPSIFSYRFAERFAGSTGPSLTSYGDGLWFSQDLSGALTLVRWGLFGDVPVPGDYNGDGFVDYAVFRPSDSSWWILFKGRDGEKDASASLRWGAPGDMAMPGDYDGDGAFDVAVYRPGTASMFIRFTDGRVRTETIGESGDVPVAAPFIQPGVTNVAAFRPNRELWLVRLSPAKGDLLEVQWGLPGDAPVTLDLDGDGVSELGVYREKRAEWLIEPLSLASDARILQFGLPGDAPLGARKLERIF